MRYKDYVDLFRKDRAETLGLHRPIDHAIDLEPGFHMTYCRIYKLSEVDMKTVKGYIETNLANRFIQRSSSPAAAPILIMKKKDGGLRRCVDSRAHNRATVKNRYPLPLISEMLDRLHGARIITKQDLRNAYHLILFKDGDKYQTVFHTWYGQFEYQVMPFGLTNAPATFQSYINNCVRPFIDDFAVCYLNNILIYSTNAVEYQEQVPKVVERLPEFGLYAKAEKCHLGVTEVGFLGFVISPHGIGMELDPISRIEDWPTPEFFRDVQVLLGFTNFYRRIFRKFLKVTTSISDLLKNAETSRTPKKLKWEWTRDADLAFRKMNRAFTDAMLLNHFHPA